MGSERELYKDAVDRIRHGIEEYSRKVVKARSDQLEAILERLVDSGRCIPGDPSVVIRTLYDGSREEVWVDGELHGTVTTEVKGDYCVVRTVIE